MQTNVHIDTKNLGGSPERRIKGPGGQTKRTLEELVVNSPNERNWRGIFIALLVIAAVLGLIVFSIILVSPPEESPRIKGIKPSLEDIFVKLPPPARFNGTWMSDNEFIFKDIFGGISLYNADNLNTSVIMTNITLRQYEVADFIVSSDLKFVLLISHIIKVYKYSTLAKYHIYEIATRERRPLSPNELDESAPYLQYATWSPDGAAVAFVYENDIYYKPKVEKDLVCRITKTGIPRLIFNGVPDWLYENEILRTSHALWFSPDSYYLLYISFNNSKVGEYSYTWYDSQNMGGIYPEVRSFRYPRVETPNPVINVWIVNLTTPKYLFPFELKPTNSVSVDSYVTSAKFNGENSVDIVWLNRAHNTFVIATCGHQSNYNCTDFHVEKEHENIGWTEPVYHPVFNENGTKALVRLPVKDGDNGHYMHVCEIYKGRVRPLTHGPFEVTKILAWDEENSFIYALATIDHPGFRHLIRIIDRSALPDWECLTCIREFQTNCTDDESYFNETILNENMWMSYRCNYNHIFFSKNLSYFIQECLGPEIPIVILAKTHPYSRLAVLDTSSKLRRRIKKFSPPQEKHISVEIEFGYRAQVKLYLPASLREYEDCTFPLVLLVDAAPSSQAVSSKWEVSWSWYLASTRSYIVAKIDARGSGYQGIKMRREIQRRIGLIEVQDQLAVLTYLRDTFKYIDNEKICVVGKGYGGYVSAMMLLQDIHQVINCSVSISPITNWRYYNSFYTEKYLGLPSKHPLEYENADLALKAANMNNRNFFLIYGTADTRVTSQHSIMLAKTLIEQNVLFRHLAYPDESYDFKQKAKLHMFKQIDLFFNDSFGPVIEDWIEDTAFFI
ncbi:inactive dipeptidyl peptidase 10 isoform X3 [Anthonomus grandis grandis]|uniref:inactive dipeptidyl peptidase 10 isoform X3 n=1 Tax=Anthonomus grandis grandis TaxID=2921223 RepID=UPI0021661D50|nr:inactive dipeptidyl peptidase 10 isoform X3 [Anthonomus grandis grandis]